MIEFAKLADLDELDELAVTVITDMKKSRIPQWEFTYPRKAHFEQDVINNALIVFREQGEILGCMAILPENDPPYHTITSWLKTKSIVIHRVLVHPHKRGLGIAKQMMKFAVEYGIKHKYESIKIDTHLDNYKMRSFLKKTGFLEGDYIAVMDRIAYEKILEDL